MELKIHLNTSDPVKAEDSVSIICGAKINKTLVDVDIDVHIHLVSPQGINACLLYTSPSPRDATLSRMPSSA